MSSNMPASPPAKQPDVSVPTLIGIGLLTRLIIDTGVKVFFPFLPILAQGMGVSTGTMGRLISLRSLMGLFSPLFGTLADRRGYRSVMQVSLLLAGLGFVVIGGSGHLVLTMVGFMLAGIGGFAFAPTLQAYLSARLPYTRRARGLSIVEYAWALAGIGGLFVAGLLIEATSWRMPFYIVGGFLLLAALFYGRLPAAKVKQPIGKSTSLFSPKADEAGIGVRVRRFLDMGENARSVWSVIATAALLMFGAFHFFISYGIWMDEEYGLGPAALGQVALALGCADLVGSVAVSLFGDWFGKRRSVLLGTFLGSLAFFALPLFNVGPITAVVGMAFASGFFEFAVVSNMAVMSEQVADQRGKVLTLSSAVAVAGSSIVGFTSPWVYDLFGVTGLGIVSGTALGLAFVCTKLFVVEPES